MKHLKQIDIPFSPVVPIFIVRHDDFDNNFSGRLRMKSLIIRYHHVKTVNLPYVLSVPATAVSSCAYNGVPTAALNLTGNQVLSCRINPSFSVETLCVEI